ncbi:hypothetical protein BsWGS_24650 [Bradybaena similaris]
METGDDEFIVCPYNDAHVIAAIRMPYHLIKCRKNYPMMDLVVCPFNANHEVNKPELKQHMLYCPNRTLLEREITFEAMREALHDAEPPMQKGFTDLPRYRDRHLSDNDDDDWDADDTSRSFMRTSRTSRLHQRNEESPSLRRPFSQAMAAVAGSPSIQHSTTSPQTPINFNGLLLGRGRARPPLSPDEASPISPGARGQSRILQPAVRPGLSEMSWTFGRGRGQLSNLQHH